MNAALAKTITHWALVDSYVEPPRNEAEYEKLLAFVDGLMEYLHHNKDKQASNLLRIIAQNIQAYEHQKFIDQKLSPVKVLKFLMEEHGLTQADLPEIGSQSLVSKILTGERQLTLNHVQLIANRFGVSPAVFYP